MQLTKTGIILSGINTQIPLYITITALTSTGDPIGSGKLYTREPGQNSAAPQCIIQGIPVNIEQIGSQYFLTWDTVP